MNYSKIAQQTIVELETIYGDQFEYQEKDVISILKDVSNTNDTYSFNKVCKWVAKHIKTTKQVEVSKWIANKFYQTDALDTCYSVFSAWLKDTKHSILLKQF